MMNLNFELDAQPFALGDMLVFGRPPAKLTKALAVIAAHLHPAVERLPRITPGISKRSCILCSLAVRDFLQRIGIEAMVAPVVAVLLATRGDETLHSAGIGVPGTVAAPRNWNGHMVVVAERFVIDTTLYQIHRPAWDHLPGMMAVPVDGAPVAPEHRRMWGLDVLTAVGTESEPGDDYRFSLAWLANPTNNRWRNGPDARRDRRRAVVGALAHHFGSWREDK